jgi:hypothetical protein
VIAQATTLGLLKVEPLACASGAEIGNVDLGAALQAGRPR